jgi:hypothetical protein
VGLIALIYAIAVAVNASGSTLPSTSVSTTTFVGLIAAGLSLPPSGVAVLFIIRPRLRRDWREADTPNRAGFIAYLTVEACAAVAAWIAFFFIATHR